MSEHKNRKIAVLSYPISHRKTFDVLSILKANGYSDVMVCTIPFCYEKKKYPIYQHRPEMNYNVPCVSEICSNLDFDYKTGQLDSFEIDRDRIVLIGGAGILDDSFVSTHKVINAHPGFIPDSRGLDSLKWAIIEDKTVGVTTHLIGEYVDAGLVIERREIPVYLNDTFHALAHRVYENEVSMLVEAIDKMDQGLQMIKPGDSVLHKRMPVELEQTLLDAFECYKKQHGIVMDERRQ